MAKERYDRSHKPLDLAEGSQVFLRLHHGYELPGITNKKLHQQRAGPFKVLKKVGQLAYRLDLPPVMQIHPVISIAQLEPVPEAADPYARPRNIMPPAVTEGNDSREEGKPYEIEKLLGKRVTGTGTVRYLVKWKDHGNEHNVWYDLDDLSDARELVQEYEDRQQLLPERPRRRRLNTSQENTEEPAPQETAKRGRGRPRKTGT